jgi:hypothetical protein
MCRAPFWAKLEVVNLLQTQKELQERSRNLHERSDNLDKKIKRYKRRMRAGASVRTAE